MYYELAEQSLMEGVVSCVCVSRHMCHCCVCVLQETDESETVYFKDGKRKIGELHWSVRICGNGRKCCI